MTATADRLLVNESELDSISTSLSRVASGIEHDVTLFLAVSKINNHINPHILHGIQADLDRIEREARALRFLLTELEGE